MTICCRGKNGGGEKVGELTWVQLSWDKFLSTLTLCRPDGPLIKYPLFPDVINALNVQPHNILLQFDTIDYASEPRTAATACSLLSSSSLNGISQNKTLCEVEQQRIYKFIWFPFASYVQHTLYTLLQDTSFFPPHQQQFFTVYVLWNPRRVCLASHV